MVLELETSRTDSRLPLPQNKFFFVFFLNWCLPLLQVFGAIFWHCIVASSTVSSSLWYFLPHVASFSASKPSLTAIFKATTLLQENRTILLDSGAVYFSINNFPIYLASLIDPSTVATTKNNDNFSSPTSSLDVLVFANNASMTAATTFSAKTVTIPLSNTQQVIYLKLTNTNYLFWHMQMKPYLIG